MLPRGLMAALLLGAVGTAAAHPRADSHDPYHRSASAYAAVLDGELLWSSNVDVHRAPASLTKLLTALVVLDSNWQPDAVLPVSHDAAHTKQPRVGLHTGEGIRADEALTAMLMHSANDACLVLAEHAAGSLEAFAARMNARAAELGMQRFSFRAPLRLRCRRPVLDRQRPAAPRQGRACRPAHRPDHRAGTGDGQHRPPGGKLSFRNTNQLLGRLEGVVGLKTGYTVPGGPLPDRRGRAVGTPRLAGAARFASPMVDRSPHHHRRLRQRGALAPRPRGALHALRRQLSSTGS